MVLRSPFRHIVAVLFDEASAGGLELYVSAVSLIEALYVASRIYQIAGVDDPNVEALNFIEWVKSRAQVVGVDEGIAVRSGELKKRLRIALPDCHVIASAEAVEAEPIFKEPEEEMMPMMNDLRRLGIRFLNEIKI